MFVHKKDILIFSVPFVFLRSITRTVAPNIEQGQIIAGAAKGIEPDSLIIMTEVIAYELKKEVRLLALSGPTHAEEVALGLPTTLFLLGRMLKQSGMYEMFFRIKTCVVY